MSNRIKYPIVLLSFLAGCLSENDPQVVDLDAEDIEVMHHPGEEEGSEALVKVKRLRTKTFAFRVGINLDKDLYLEALDAPAERDPSVPDAKLQTAIDITLTVTDLFGRVRHIDPICPPIVSADLNPDIRNNFVRLSPLIEWDRLSDDGELMRGRVFVKIEATLLAEHDHRFHDELDTHVLDSSSVTIRTKLPRIHGNNGHHHDDEDHDEDGE